MYQLRNDKFTYVWVMREREVEREGGREEGREKRKMIMSQGHAWMCFFIFPQKAHDFFLLSPPICVVIWINALSTSFQI